MEIIRKLEFISNSKRIENKNFLTSRFKTTRTFWHILQSIYWFKKMDLCVCMCVSLIFLQCFRKHRSTDLDYSKSIRFLLMGKHAELFLAEAGRTVSSNLSESKNIHFVIMKWEIEYILAKTSVLKMQKKITFVDQFFFLIPIRTLVRTFYELFWLILIKYNYI